MDKTSDPGKPEEWRSYGITNCFARCFRGPCLVTNIERKRFGAGFATADEVVVSHRMIVVERGGLDYAIDGERRRLSAGNWLWVPAWSRRRWLAVSGGCSLCWCEFTTDPVTVPAGLHLVKRADAETRLRLAEMEDRWTERDAWAALVLEAEVKRLAAKFWSQADSGADTKTTPLGEPHPEVRRAMAWLETNYPRADALECFYRELGLSPNHFRLLFRRQTGETVQAVIGRLRLRRARYLVMETALSMKEIAAQAGFDDPLYFSSSYRKFWGRSPSVDRGGGAWAA